MKHSVRARRQTPAIAEQNAESALENIRRKIAFLAKLIERDTKGVGGLPVGLPTSPRQFNQWELDVEQERNGVAVNLRTNSQRTLKKHIAECDETERLVKIVADRYRKSSVEQREDSKAKLRVQLREERELSAMANRGLVRAKIEIERLERRIAMLESSKASAVEVQREEIVKQQQTIGKLEAENAHLRTRVDTSAKLRRV